MLKPDEIKDIIYSYQKVSASVAYDIAVEICAYVNEGRRFCQHNFSGEPTPNGFTCFKCGINESELPPYGNSPESA